MTIPLADPSDSAWYEFDWADALPSGQTINAATHTVPSPLTKVAEANTTTASQVRISGALHGGLYMIEAQVTLTPSGETLNRQFPLRAFNG